MTPKVGQVEDGYGFIGGDPSDKNSWKQVGSVEDGYTYLGGDPSKQESWKPVEVQSPSSYAMKDEPIEVFQEGDTPFMERALSSTPVDTLRGLGKGVTFGFGDELAGAVGATIDPLLYGNEEGKSWSERYKENRDYARKDYEQASERSPVATTVGEIGGSIASPVSKIGYAAKGAKALAGVGALQGGLFGLGESEAEGAGGMLVDTAKGATIGGAFGFGAGKAGEYLSNKAATTGKALEQKGTAKILGTYPADAVKMESLNVKVPDVNSKVGYVDKKVSEALPQFVKENKFSPVTSYNKMSGQIEKVKQEAGKAISEVADEFDRQMNKFTMDSVVDYLNQIKPGVKGVNGVKNIKVRQLDRSEIAYIPDLKKMDDVIASIEGYPNSKQVINKINELKDDLTKLTEKGKTGIFKEEVGGITSLKKLQNLRQWIDGEINYNKVNQSTSKFDDVLRDLRSDIHEHITNKMLPKLDEYGGTELKKKLLKANYEYTMATKVENILDKSAARNAKNEIFNIKDILIGAAGGIGLDPITGGIGGLVARQGLEKGGQFVQQRAPEIMRGTGKAIRKALPVATQQVQEIDPVENFLNNPNMKK